MHNDVNGEIKNYNMVDLAKIAFDHKPTADEAGKLQYLNQSKKTAVTPSSLADFIQQGYAFHPGVTKRGIKKINKKTGEEYSVITFREDVVDFQNVFAIDIDHHNFTLDEILSRCLIKPSIVYKTWSYTEENKRWRVVFFGNKAVKDTEEIKRINIVLTSPFMEGLSDDVLAYSDIVSISPARLFYAGSEVVYVDDNARFNIEQLLSNKKVVNNAMKLWAKAEYEVKEHDKRVRRVAQFRDYLTGKEWKEYLALAPFKTSEFYFFCKDMCKKLEKMGFDLSKTLKQQRKTTGSKKLPKPKVSTGTRAINKDLLNDILANLKDYLTDVPNDIDYATAIEMINALPIHEMIGVDLDVHFQSLTRIENNASAMFFEGEDGNILYHDFGTSETLSAMGLLAEMMATEFGTIFYSSLEMLLSSVDASLSSQYRKDAVEQINFGRDYVIDIIEGHITNESEKIFDYGLGRLYVGCCNLLTRYIPKSSLLENRQGVVVYRALEEFHKSLLTGLYADMSTAKIQSYRTFVRKLNFLCYLGFFRKVQLDEMKSSVKAGINEHKIKLMVEKEIDEKDYMIPNFYEFAPVTPQLLKEALRRYELFFERGGRMGTISHKTLRAIDKELAREVYHQTTGTLNQTEIKFKDLCIKNARRRLNSQSYFIRDEVLENILKTDNWFNGKIKVTPDEIKLDIDKKTGTIIPKANKQLAMKRKQETFQKLKAHILNDLNAQEIRSSKATREQYNVVEDVKYSFFVPKTNRK